MINVISEKLITDHSSLIAMTNQTNHSVNQAKSFLIRDLLESSSVPSISEIDSRDDSPIANQLEIFSHISREQHYPIKYANLCHLQASTNIWPSMATFTCFTCISPQDRSRHWNSGFNSTGHCTNDQIIDSIGDEDQSFQSNRISLKPRNSPFNSSLMNRKVRRNRTVFTELQLMGLERRFDTQKYLSTPDRAELARALGLTQLQVKTWYQNRRMKWKKQVMLGGCPVPPTKPKGRPKKNSIPSLGMNYHNNNLLSSSQSPYK
ncbi:uncharacterized protein LOC141854110 [Brevipalpus obovatus]|uniref:uncharacterized protein LOC141854110 n=1 Tax=Brevipalpus obovatus TaxID=246614 RepID=UPI003D9EBE7B